MGRCRHIPAVLKPLTAAFFLAVLLGLAGCRSSRSGEFEILGPVDETDEAAKLVQSANEDLQQIKVLYNKNEDKREAIKKALEANNAEEVKRISDDVVYAINDGFDFGKSAVDKLDKAEGMNVNEDYREYLRLKEESLRKQMEAFEEYRQAARTLRDNYDPKDVQQREKVKEEFKKRSENYARITEKARDLSNQANEIAKDALQKQKAGG